MTLFGTKERDFMIKIIVLAPHPIPYKFYFNTVLHNVLCQYYYFYFATCYAHCIFVGTIFDTIFLKT